MQCCTIQETSASFGGDRRPSARCDVRRSDPPKSRISRQAIGELAAALGAHDKRLERLPDISCRIPLVAKGRFFLDLTVPSASPKPTQRFKLRKMCRPYRARLGNVCANGKVAQERPSRERTAEPRRESRPQRLERGRFDLSAKIDRRPNGRKRERRAAGDPVGRATIHGGDRGAAENRQCGREQVPAGAGRTGCFDQACREAGRQPNKLNGGKGPEQEVVRRSHAIPFGRREERSYPQANPSACTASPPSVVETWQARRERMPYQAREDAAADDVQSRPVPRQNTTNLK